MNWVERNWSWPFFDFTTSQTATEQKTMHNNSRMSFGCLSVFEKVSLSPRHPNRLRDRSWHQSSITEVLQENIVAYYQPS